MSDTPTPTRWRFVTVEEQRCELVVTADEMRAWSPELAALAGDDDEVLAGLWGETLTVDWDECTVTDGHGHTWDSDTAEFGIDESGWAEEVVE